MRLGLIEIDTLAAAFALADENDAAEAQQALRHMRMLGDPIGALVMPIHHYGKSEETGLRGSSAYRGGADAVLSVLADRKEATGEVGVRSLNLAKTRHGEEGPIAVFSLRFVQLGLDEDGDIFGACVVDPGLDEPIPTSRRREPKDTLAIVALKGAFDEVMLTHGRDVQVRGPEPLLTETIASFHHTADGRRAADKTAASVLRALQFAEWTCPGSAA